MVEMKTGTHDRGTTFFPLYRYDSLLGGAAEKVHNLTGDFVKEWCVATQTKFVAIGRGDGISCPLSVLELFRARLGGESSTCSSLNHHHEFIGGRNPRSRRSLGREHRLD
jgi:hypothetical protein